MSILIYSWKCLLFSLSIDVRKWYKENGSCTSTTNPTKLIKMKKKKKKKMKRIAKQVFISSLLLFFCGREEKNTTTTRRETIWSYRSKYPREKVCCVIFGHLAKERRERKKIYMSEWVCVDVYMWMRGSCSRIFHAPVSMSLLLLFFLFLSHIAATAAIFIWNHIHLHTEREIERDSASQ